MHAFVFVLFFTLVFCSVAIAALSAGFAVHALVKARRASDVGRTLALYDFREALTTFVTALVPLALIAAAYAYLPI